MRRNEKAEEEINSEIQCVYRTDEGEATERNVR